jgi:hypothetical protein
MYVLFRNSSEKIAQSYSFQPKMVFKYGYFDLWGKICDKNFTYHRTKGPAVLEKAKTSARLICWVLDGCRYAKISEYGYYAKYREPSNKNYPSIIYFNGTKEWLDDYEKLHRDRNRPAIEYANGDKEWFRHGKRHRENGPAVIYGKKKYWFKYGRFEKES